MFKLISSYRWDVVVPKELWRHWWRKGNLRDYPEDEQALFGTTAPPTFNGSSPRPLIAEGTGFLDPRPVPPERESHVKQEELWQKIFEKICPAGFRGLRKMFHYWSSNRKSRFYQTFCLLFTNQFLRTPAASTRKCICFAVCYTAPGGAAAPTVGVTFNELVSNHDGVSLWSEPAINAVESTCIRDAMKDLFPMPPLQPPARPDEAPRDNPFPPPPTAAAASADYATTTTTVLVEYYLKSQLATDERLQAMKRAFASQQLQGLVLSVESQWEGVTKDLGGWRIVVRCRAMGVEQLELLLDSAHTISSCGLTNGSDDDDD